MVYLVARKSHELARQREKIALEARARRSADLQGVRAVLLRVPLYRKAAPGLGAGRVVAELAEELHNCRRGLNARAPGKETIPQKG